jgi:hypothetical protein
MPSGEDVPTFDDIADSVAEDVAAGVAQFSTGDTSVSAMDPMKRLDIADRIKRNAAAANGVGNILGNTRRLISPGAWS